MWVGEPRLAPTSCWVGFERATHSVAPTSFAWRGGRRRCGPCLCWRLKPESPAPGPTTGVVTLCHRGQRGKTRAPREGIWFLPQRHRGHRGGGPGVAGTGEVGICGWASQGSPLEIVGLGSSGRRRCRPCLRSRLKRESLAPGPAAGVVTLLPSRTARGRAKARPYKLLGWVRAGDSQSRPYEFRVERRAAQVWPLFVLPVEALSKNEGGGASRRAGILHLWGFRDFCHRGQRVKSRAPREGIWFFATETQRRGGGLGVAGTGEVGICGWASQGSPLQIVGLGSSGRLTESPLRVSRGEAGGAGVVPVCAAGRSPCPKTREGGASRRAGTLHLWGFETFAPSTPSQIEYTETD